MVCSLHGKMFSISLSDLLRAVLHQVPLRVHQDRASSCRKEVFLRSERLILLAWDCVGSFKLMKSICRRASMNTSLIQSNRLASLEGKRIQTDLYNPSSPQQRPLENLSIILRLVSSERLSHSTILGLDWLSQFIDFG